MKTIKKKLWAIQKPNGDLCTRAFMKDIPFIYPTKARAKDSCAMWETPIKVTVTVERVE